MIEMAYKKLKVGIFPPLRFPEFEGKWEKKRLGGIGDVKMCRRVFNNETSPTGDIPFFKIGSFGKVADAFISKDGKYVLTFARDAENKTIKRVLFLYDGSQVRGYADDVVDMNTIEIKTTQGSVRVGDGQLLAD